MADTLKPKQLAGILESIPKDKLGDAAAELGVDATKLNAFIKKPTGKFLQAVADKLEPGVKGAQNFVDKFVGRKPPSVPSEFAKEQIKPTGETGFQITGQPGGPLVPTTQTRNLPDTTAITPDVVDSTRLNGVQRRLTPGVLDVEPVSTDLVPVGQPRTGMSQEELADLARQAKPGTPGQVVTERMPRIRQSLGDDMNEGLDLPTFQVPKITPETKTIKKAAAASAGLLALAGLYNLPKASEAVKEAKIDKPEDTKEKINEATKLPNTLEEPKQKVLQGQSEKITKISKSIEELMQEVKDERKAEQARLELLKVTETIMHGLVTAIGANALLNRNSPFAVDFSQGPKTDWNAQFDRLQRDFDAQTDALIKKYNIQEDTKIKQEELALKKRDLDVKEQQANQEATKQQAETLAKLNEADKKTYMNNLKHFGDLRRAIADKKPGAVQDAATLLGADDATIAKLTDSMNQGTWGKILATLGMSEQPTTEQILQGLRPQKPAPVAAAPAAAAPAAAVQLPSALIDPNGTKIVRPQGMADAQWKSAMDAIEAKWKQQNKTIKKEY